VQQVGFSLHNYIKMHCQQNIKKKYLENTYLFTQAYDKEPA